MQNRILEISVDDGGRQGDPRAGVIVDDRCRSNFLCRSIERIDLVACDERRERRSKHETELEPVGVNRSHEAASVEILSSVEF